MDGFYIGSLHIKFYGLLIAAAMVFGVFLAARNTKHRNLKSDDIYILALYILPLAIIGARLYYIIFSGRSYTFLEAISIWNGGLAIYGGVIGGAIGAGLYCLIHKKNFLNVADVAVPSLILGQAIGRWGNFFNQEAFGYEVTNPNLQWFPFSVFIESEGTWHLATFFYESMWNLIVFVILLIMLKKVKEKGIVMSSYFILYGIGRTLIEGLRTDSLYLWNTGIRVSQALSILLIVFGIIMIGVILFLKHKRNKIAKDSSS